MIKKLDILIIRSFIGPFIVTFFVALFVLVMQFFWLYMDELIGKGLGIWMILQLLFYMSSTMVPMALPLGILLAAIMTFGSMGEHFELVAIKSSGISLSRFLQPLLLFIIGVAMLAFYFNNNIIPVANLKALSLLYDMRNSKPTLNIRAGQFNRDIDGFAIRVGDKDRDGRTIRNVLVYDHTSGHGNDKVVIAEEGEMFASPNKQYLIFRLKNGCRYEEDVNRDGTYSHQQRRMYFKTWDKVFDLSDFKMSRTNEDLFKGAYQMMNISQLNQELDSMNSTRRRLSENVSSYLKPYISVMMASDSTVQKLRHRIIAKIPVGNHYDTAFLEQVPDSQQYAVAQMALQHIRNAKGLLDISANEQKIQHENRIKYNIEWHRKFTLSFACVLLFLIGAPLGAIIRRGGLGMPLIIAIIFFMLFHIISITGEKLAKSSTLEPWAGMWMATVMLLPIAFYFINAAKKDAQVFNKKWYLKVWNLLRGLFVKNKA